MGKGNAATETATTTDKKEKARAGSSIPAQAKTLVVATYTELVEGLAALTKELNLKTPLTLANVLTEGTAEWLASLNNEITANAQRGLPLAVRMQNVETEINEHWQLLASMPTKNGKVTPTPEWEAKSFALMTKKANLQRAAKREKDGTTGTDAESATTDSTIS